jgi:hypothetical protein
MARCWVEHGDQITSERLADHPGERPWFAWVRILLPDEPRQRVDDGYERDEGMAPPRGRAWEQSGGYESSMAYLARHELLTAAEIDRLRSENEVPRALEYSRIHTPKAASTFHPADLSAIRRIIGGDLLTDAEIEAAAAWEASR